jgi:pimeloyl-ACP methyl ester carboxylesterase
MSLYDAFSIPPNPLAGTEFDRNIYRSVSSPTTGRVEVVTPFRGIDSETGALTNVFEIAYTQWGDKGPVVLMLHGVPTNRRQYLPIQKRLAPFCRTVSIDMLGMGESSKPLEYGTEDKIARIASRFGLPPADHKPWDWVFDTEYVDDVMETLYPGEKFVFVSDDWGSGISTHYAARYGSKRLIAHIGIDCIALDGYPVSEIQAIGRASQTKDQATFEQMMGSFDQTMVVILKQMVKYKNRVFNQYSLRNFKFPYMDVDYERSGADSLTMRLNYDAIRVLADRAAVLAPDLLLPFDRKNPKGVRFDQIDVPTAILWGVDGDPMMPDLQRFRLVYAHTNTYVQPIAIHDAGHLAGLDQPDRVAEAILSFIITIVGARGVADVFVGFDGIFKGDEKEFIAAMRQRLYKS